MRLLGNIFYTVSITLLVAVAGLFFVSVAPLERLSGGIGSIDIKIVRSGSMEPSIQTGAIVLIKPENSYRAGDVITFGEDSASSVPTTHRIVSVEGTGASPTYVTKGDANEEADPREIAHREVIGKVLFDVPYAGYVLDFARQPLGFVLLIGLPAAIIIFDEICTIWQEIRAARRRRRPGIERLSTRARKTNPAHTSRQDIVLVRRSVTDDILIPMRRPFEPPIRAKEQSAASPLFVVLVAGAACVAVLGNIGTTVSYLRNAETATDNQFISGVLNLELVFTESANTFLALSTEDAEETPGGSERALLTISEGDGSFPLQYHLFADIENATGELCPWLDLDVSFEGVHVYAGQLSDFSGTTTSQFGQWEFALDLSSGGSGGTSCAVDVVFSAWRADTHLFVDSGYTDRERVTLMLTKEEEEASAPQLLQSILPSEGTDNAEEPATGEEQGEGDPEVPEESVEISEEENEKTEGKEQDEKEVLPEKAEEEATVEEKEEEVQEEEVEGQPEDESVEGQVETEN